MADLKPILLVEDNPKDLELTLAALERSQLANDVVTVRDGEEALARISGHLTPALLGHELEKLKRDVPIYIYGPKPRFVKRISRELDALKRKNMKLFVQGRTYTV